MIGMIITLHRLGIIPVPIIPRISNYFLSLYQYHTNMMSFAGSFSIYSNVIVLAIGVTLYQLFT